MVGFSFSRVFHMRRNQSWQGALRDRAAQPPLTLSVADILVDTYFQLS